VIGRLLDWLSARVVTFYDVQRHFVRGAIVVRVDTDAGIYDVQRHFVRGAIGTGSRLASSVVARMMADGFAVRKIPAFAGMT